MPGQHSQPHSMSDIPARLRDLFPEMAPAVASELLDVLAQWPVTVVTAPQTGLVMVTVTDCFGTPFHMGEMLVTTAEVALNSSTGHATISGDDANKAMVAATVDAMSRDGFSEGLDAVAAALDQLERTCVGQKAMEARWTSATRVDFETMAEE